ncbi:MAG TPA: hypothetical protein VFM18_18135 [Methanosarcina sp.]|nr:hypothetical protein [Methanosarcina sp.]
MLENPDCEIIMQKDPEGNGFSPMSGIEMDVVYIEDHPYFGEPEVFSKDREAEDHCLDENEWEELKKTNSGYAVIYPKY